MPAPDLFKQLEEQKMATSSQETSTAALEQKLTALQNQFAVFTAKVEADNAAQANEIKALKADNAALKADNAAQANEIKALKTVIDSQAMDIKALQGANNEKTKEINDLKSANAAETQKRDEQIKKIQEALDRMQGRS